MSSLGKDVSKIGEGLIGATAHSDKEISDLRTTLSESLSKAEVSLGKSISSITLPPEKTAALSFSLWEESASLRSPMLAMTLSPDASGAFEIPFTFGNPTNNAVKMADTWIDICDVCTFAEEPAEFQKTSGTSDRTRTKSVNLNPGTNLPKMTIKVKLSRPIRKFQVGFRYSCDVCGDMFNRAEQAAWIEVKQ